MHTHTAHMVRSAQPRAVRNAPSSTTQLIFNCSVSLAKSFVTFCSQNRSNLLECSRMKFSLILVRSTVGLQRMFSTTATAQVNKAALSTLRKKTGYTFSNCKKALEQFGDDLTTAEKWLREQAQKEGWAKATKLQDRVVSQGLVGVKYNPEDGTGVLVEINCETDFVARNGKFHDLVSSVAEACSRELQLKAIDGASYHKWSIMPELLSSFKSSHDKTLGDLTALTIGTMGENMVLRRALLIKTDPRECKISGYAHSADNLPSSKGCFLGRYGALVIYRHLPAASHSASEVSQVVAEPPDQLSTEDIGRQLCQHVVGMNPQTIGQMEEPAVVAEMDRAARTDKFVGTDEAAGTEEGEKKRPETDEDENRLIYQEFLADPTLTVRDVLEQNNMEVLDFVRFEVGGKLPDAENSS